MRGWCKDCDYEVKQYFTRGDELPKGANPTGRGSRVYWMHAMNAPWDNPCTTPTPRA